MKELSNEKQLVIFDGVCNLCNTSVQYIIRHDKKDIFRFTALQSETGQDLVHKFNIDTAKTDSIILYSELKGICYKSTAVLKIASHLGFPRNILKIFLIIPPFIRNWFYDLVAKNRYKWYGKRETCIVPTAELQNKFI